MILKNFFWKETILKTLLDRRKHNDFIFITVIALLFFSILFLTYRHIRNKNMYGQNFEDLMKKNEVTKVEVKNINKRVLNINKDTVASVLKQLEKFEKDKKFLKKDLSLAKLTAAFDSNSKYLSQIIYHYRGKKFTKYINDLKVDYIILLLKQDKRIRNYTNMALAEEAGFSSTQRFANAFLARAEMSTSFFIEELKKGES